MVAHSSTLAWKIPRMEEPDRLQSHGVRETDMTEWLHYEYFLIYIYIFNPDCFILSGSMEKFVDTNWIENEVNKSSLVGSVKIFHAKAGNYSGMHVSCTIYCLCLEARMFKLQHCLTTVLLYKWCFLNAPEACRMPLLFEISLWRLSGKEPAC